MKKFIQSWGRKARFAAILAASTLATSAMAEGETATAVPAAVTTAIGDLETAATNYAAAIFPYIARVGLAFVGIGVFYLLFRVWRRFAGGR